MSRDSWSDESQMGSERALRLAHIRADALPPQGRWVLVQGGREIHKGTEPPPKHSIGGVGWGGIKTAGN